MEPREIAKDLIRDYVERGDSFDNLKGYMGRASTDYWAEIKRDKIYVTEIKGVECFYSFALKEIYDELKNGEQPSLF